MATWYPANPNMSLTEQALAIQSGAYTGPSETMYDPGVPPEPLIIPQPFTNVAPGPPQVIEDQPNVGALAAVGAAVSPYVVPALGALAGWLFSELTEGPGGSGLGIGGGSGSGMVIPGSNVPLGGPGLPEPPAWMVAKEWHVNNAQFYKLIDGRIAVYSKKKKTWKVYRPPKHIVISKNPRVTGLLKAEKKINKLMTALARSAGMVKRGSGTRGKKKLAVPQGMQIINVD